MSFLGRLARAVVREGLTTMVTSAASEAGEALGKRIGAWIYPVGVDQDAEEDDEDEDEDEEETDAKSVRESNAKQDN